MRAIIIKLIYSIFLLFILSACSPTNKPIINVGVGTSIGGRHGGIGIGVDRDINVKKDKPYHGSVIIGGGI